MKKRVKKRAKLKDLELGVMEIGLVLVLLAMMFGFDALRHHTPEAEETAQKAEVISG